MRQQNMITSSSELIVLNGTDVEDQPLAARDPYSRSSIDEAKFRTRLVLLAIKCDPSDRTQRRGRDPDQADILLEILPLILMTRRRLEDLRPIRPTEYPLLYDVEHRKDAKAERVRTRTQRRYEQYPKNNTHNGKGNRRIQRELAAEKEEAQKQRQDTQGDANDRPRSAGNDGLFGEENPSCCRTDCQAICNGSYREIRHDSVP